MNAVRKTTSVFFPRLVALTVLFAGMGAVSCKPEIVGGTETSDSAQQVLDSTCKDDALNAEQCSTAPNRYVTGAAGAAVSGADGVLSKKIPAGFYDGSQSCTMSDSNLTATNIRSGTTIFGITGTLSTSSSSTTSAYANCTDNALNASQCSTQASRYVTATAGANVTGSNGQLTTTVPAGYYSGSTTVTAADTSLIAANILSTATIFGVTGSATQGTTLYSTQHRDATTTQATQTAEAVTNAATVYTNTATGNPGGYRAIPNISIDDDGYTGGNVTAVSRTNWNTTCDSGTGASGGSANSVCTCGLSGTIAARIANCAAHGVIGAGATWNGATKGNAAQGSWKLVTRTAATSGGKGREVWQDQQTLLIWSSKLSTATNWCKSTGSNNIAGNPVAQDDPNDVCDNASYQNTAGQAISACFEDDGTYFTQTDASLDSAGKGGLSRSSTPVVGWRTPTKYDYQRADINGIRFVMPDMAATAGGSEWVATVSSSGRTNGWVFGGTSGNIAIMGRSTATNSVRCVGR